MIANCKLTVLKCHIVVTFSQNLVPAPGLSPLSALAPSILMKNSQLTHFWALKARLLCAKMQQVIPAASLDF